MDRPCMIRMHHAQGGQWASSRSFWSHSESTRGCPQLVWCSLSLSLIRSLLASSHWSISKHLPRRTQTVTTSQHTHNLTTFDLVMWVWVKIGYPNNWMVNTKLDIHICGPLNGLPFWPTSKTISPGSTAPMVLFSVFGGQTGDLALEDACPLRYPLVN